ncbi:MAG: NADPH-dependent 7-cyano-7-deazaguanine reductase QueF [Rhodanobacter denitrificans]|uniref:NADPH-dependent 7-cyano-7-deazaguanine reductase n=1 Tax=Rhodanobacter denitrificans TaxID=666685 RepID=A0A2W5M6J1_9GAMM|nr:MAG: NADPH-dependent 7-cyano-7-deazaguanine reductase QueF [Rhodanobacter denitrificans]
MSTPHDSPLGRTVTFGADYDPSLLFPIPRAPKRAEIGIAGALPFVGVDIWNVYELSWLDANGRPRVAVATFRVPADSPNIVESKSLKLYLNSYNQTRLADAGALRERLEADLGGAAGAAVGIELLPLPGPGVGYGELEGESIDEATIQIGRYAPPDPDALIAYPRESHVEETLVSRALRSNCPVTGQPDWADLQIAYAGAPIDRAGLLRYLLSYRLHDDFHEQCVERIFVDVARRCAPRRLSVYARYTRRGGIDINPWRATAGSMPPPNLRTARQ